MPIKKRHPLNHGQMAVYIIDGDGNIIQWESRRSVPLAKLAADLLKIVDTLTEMADRLPVEETVKEIKEPPR